MKRYLVFAGDSYYATGGWGDYKGDFDDAKEAVARGKEYEQEHAVIGWWHVVDTYTGTIVHGKNGSYSGIVKDYKAGLEW